MNDQRSPRTPNSTSSSRKPMRIAAWALAGVTALALLAPTDAVATPAAFSFTPPNPGWVPALLGGAPLFDPAGDTPGSRDIVGDTANPLLYVASDATHMYFRLRVSSDPLQNATNFGPFGWGCFINTDADPTTYEYSMIIDGVNNPDAIYFYKNTVTLTPNSPSDEPDLPAVSTVYSPLTAAVKHAEAVPASSTFGGDPDYFVDWALELSTALSVGFDPSKPARYYCGSANNGTTITADCSGGSASGCTLSSQFSDPISCGATGCGVCGDGTVGGSEGCDDGNLVNGDGCNSQCLKELGQTCTLSAQCASGFCDPAGNVCACDQDTDCPTGKLCNTLANPNTCVSPGCGNGVLEAGEACDDGNLTAGDGCNASCLLELGQACTVSAQCASGFCDPAGNVCACDQDADCPTGKLCNTLTSPNACVSPGCGNGVLEAGEGCDDGNLLAGDGCNALCLKELGQTCTLSAQCASGFCDPAGNVCACDQDTDCPAGQLCNTALNPNVCTGPGCGNGVLEAGEGCDDGNLLAGDGCNSACLLELGQTCTLSAQCASGFCDPAGNVCACDQDADCPSGQLCKTSTNPNACVAPGCGNGVLEPSEGCDDGNLVNGDGCNSACLLDLGQACTAGASCASGFCDPAGNVCACDQDADCPSGQLCKTSTDPNVCVAPGCGNGVLEPSEGCDDGNLANGDGCNSACLLELGQACTAGAECASGFCDPSGSICACDQDADCPSGQLCNTTANPNVCVAPGCGNGVLEANEGCDDANLVDGDGCNASCLIEIGQGCTASIDCASGFCDPAGNVCACDQDADCPSGEQCNTTVSPNQCVPPGCGNGVLEATEACDDGNLVNGDGCNAQCSLEIGKACTANASCASGFCDPAGNTCACDQDADCASGELCNTAANPNVCVAPGCGNGVREPSEGCDDGNLVSGDGCNGVCLLELGQPCVANASCASGNCDLSGSICSCAKDSDCPAGRLCNTAANPNVCVAPGCGNGVLEAGEGCDDGNTAGGDGCNDQCLLEIGQACTANASCASAFCDPTDNTCACDGDNDCPAGQVCDTAANPNVCKQAGCGNGVLEATEACDDGNLLAGDGCDGACLREIGQPCTLSGQCASGFCDPAGNVCACDQSSDCHSGQQCNTTLSPNQCVPAGCGNGVLEPTEGCDDGNLVNGDGCSAQCLVELGQPCTGSGECGSGFCDPAGNTCACDQDSDCPAGQLCNTAPNPNTCVPAGCGNGVLEAGEGCDDGNTVGGDGCSAQCLIELGQTCTDPTACASGLCEGSSGTCACIKDSDCPAGQLCNTAADPNTCVAPGCGNGVLEANEGCDDGNLVAGDGCSAECLVEIGQACGTNTVCVSGHCDPTGKVCVCGADTDCPSGQVCDLGANPPACKPAGCGNGVLEANEGCDDGNIVGGDGCNAACLIEIGKACGANTACASGHCDPTGNACVCGVDTDCPTGQVCDTQASPPACKPAGCGNGVLEAGEGCDDSNSAAGDGCNAACLIELGHACSAGAACASGHCDANGDICSCDEDTDCPSGQLCDTGASPSACVDAICGDGKIGGGEKCDDGDTAAGDGCSETCTVEPGWTCTGEPSVCTPNPHCTKDADCEARQICDVTAGLCNTVECTVDTDCQAGSTCDADKHECKPLGFYASGNGCACVTGGATEGRADGLIVGLVGLLAIAARRARRRR